MWNFVYFTWELQLQRGFVDTPAALINNRWT